MSHYFSEQPAPPRTSARSSSTSSTRRSCCDRPRRVQPRAPRHRHRAAPPPGATAADGGRVPRPRMRRRGDRPHPGPTVAGSRVVAIDVNERARRLCAANAARNGLRNVDGRGAGRRRSALRFDLIWSNPPIRIGKAQLHELLTTWLSDCADGYGGPRRAEAPRRRLAAAWLERQRLADRAAGLVEGVPAAAGHAQTRGGSTAMRTREPFGRSAAMRPRPSWSHVGARDEVVVGVTADGEPGTPATGRRPRRCPVRSRWRAPLAGGSPSSSRRSTFGVEEPGRIGEQRRLDHLVVGHERLDHQPSAAPAWSEQAGRLGEQRHRLLAGAVARRQQFAIEVEEGDDVGARRRGGAPPRCRRRPRPARERAVSLPVTATTGRPAAASSSSRSRVTPGRRLAKPGSAAHLAHRRALAPHRRQTSRPSSPSPTAASQRVQRSRARHVRQARIRARPVVLCTQTTRHSGRRSWRINADDSSEVRHGSSSLRSTMSTIGQPARSSSTAQADERAARRRRRRRPSGTVSSAAPAAPARRARSITTSRACHVGLRSSCNVSSCSSMTTATPNSGHGAHAAPRAPITTSTPAAAQCPLSRARRRRAARAGRARPPSPRPGRPSASTTSVRP